MYLNMSQLLLKKATCKRVIDFIGIDCMYFNDLSLIGKYTV